MSQFNQIIKAPYAVSTTVALFAVLIDGAASEHVMNSGSTTLTTTSTTGPIIPAFSRPTSLTSAG